MHLCKASATINRLSDISLQPGISVRVLLIPVANTLAAEIDTPGYGTGWKSRDGSAGPAGTTCNIAPRLRCA